VIRPGAGGRFAAVPFQIPPQARQRPNQRPNLQQQNQGAPQQPNPNLQQKGNLPAPKRGGGRGERLKKLNPFAPRRNDQLPR